MREQYIPDLTERFPEGFDGVDMTDKYFPCECGYDYESALWESAHKSDDCVDFDDYKEF